MVVTEGGTSTIDESRAVKDENQVKQLLNDLKADENLTTDLDDANAIDGSEDGGVGEGGGSVVGETYQMRAAREKKEQQKEAIVKLMGKFVNLTDLFPPLPKKGEFDVGSIKKSQYFFS